MLVLLHTLYTFFFKLIKMVKTGPYRVRGTWGTCPRRKKEGAQNRLLNWLFLGLNLIKKVDCCIFWPAFGCCAHAGQNMLFQKILNKKAEKRKKKQEILWKIHQKNVFLLHWNAGWEINTRYFLSNHVINLLLICLLSRVENEKIIINRA